jgi:histidinol phosphatase-like enzyme
MTKIDLLVIDLDGTLAQTYSPDLFPHVKAFFDLLFQAGCPDRPRLAIATNQGGVGLRHWMERDEFGEPFEYPTSQDVDNRLRQIVSALGGDLPLPVYVSYRYQDRSGDWSPIPPGEESNPRWQAAWRKPNPGMLLQAMEDAGVSPRQTLYVGETPGRPAGCSGCRLPFHLG